MADVQLAETLFAAMDEIIHKRIEVLPYDKTILATIEVNDNAANGEYIVNDGITTMRAFSDNPNYNVGERVYVNIPQRDYNQQKNIIGKYVVDSNNVTPIGYRDPMNDLVDISGNLFRNELDTFTLIANGEKKETDVLWTWSATPEEDNPFVGFDMIGLSAGFQSTVGHNQMITEGNYGLRLDIAAIRNTAQSYEDNVVYYSFYLDSNGFFGDPYNFETFYQQSKTLDLKERDITRIDAMRLVFYQKDNFLNEHSERISGDIEGYNLAVNNIQLKIGYNINNFKDKDNTVLLFTYDPKTYINSITNSVRQKYGDKGYEFDNMNEIDVNNFLAEVNLKNIQCRWIYKDADGNLECYGSNQKSLPSSAELRWYRYVYEEQDGAGGSAKSVDPPGEFWEEIEDNRNLFELKFSPNIQKHSEKIKAIVWNPSQSYIEQTIEEDNNYVEAERYVKASQNMLLNFDPLEFIRLCLSDPKRMAQIRREVGLIKLKNQKISRDIAAWEVYYLQQIQDIQQDTSLTEVEKNQKIEELNERNVIKHNIQIDQFDFDESDENINNIFNELLSSSNKEDLYLVCDIIINIIKKLKEYFIYEVPGNTLHFRYFYFYIQDPYYEGKASQRIAKELEFLQEFYEKNYVRLSNLRTPFDSRYWQTEISEDIHDSLQQCMDEFCIEKNTNSTLNMTTIFRYIYTAKANQNDPRFYYEKIVNEFDRILALNEADAESRDYAAIKEGYNKLLEKVEENASIYKKQWFTGDETYPVSINENWTQTSLEENQYKQVQSMSLFNSIYNLNKANKEAVINSLKGNSVYTQSNELEFLNEDPSAWLEFDTLRNLRLEVDSANQKGIYKVYNEDGSIVNDSDVTTVRYITAYYTNAYTGDESIDVAEKVIWKIPKYETMIVKPEENIEYGFYDEAYPTELSFSSGTYYKYNTGTKAYEVATQYENSTRYYIPNNLQFEEDDDYYIISRQMPLKNNTVYGKEENSSMSIGFRIQGHYSPSLKNNTIQCTVVRNNKPLTQEATLLFGVQDLNGTDYNFVLQLANNQPWVVYQGEPVDIIARVYDQEGHLVENPGTIRYSWYNEGDGGLSLNTSTGTITPVKDDPENNITTSINDYLHYILKAETSGTEVTVGGNIFNLKLQAFLPIVVVRENFNYSWTIQIDQATSQTFTELCNIYRYDGRGYITYNDSGTNPTYYKDPFAIYIWDKNTRRSKEVDNATWEMTYSSSCYRDIEKEIDGALTTVKEVAKEFFPNIDSNRQLLVPSIYLQYNVDDNTHKTEVPTLVAKVNDEIVFIMPFYISFRVYNSSLINAWDGKLTLDEKNGTILSTMIGAGYKDPDNKFNGILMGYNKEDNGTDLYYNGTGLYGYNGGIKSFGFNINGYGFIGKPSVGQIRFNGNEGIIESAGFNQTLKDGVRIDLKNGNIIATHSGQIGCWNLNLERLWCDTAGVSRYVLDADNNVKYPAFWAGNGTGNNANFYVTHNGLLYAKDATIEGTIRTKMLENGTYDIAKYYTETNDEGVKIESINFTNKINRWGMTIETKYLPYGNGMAWPYSCFEVYNSSDETEISGNIRIYDGNVWGKLYIGASAVDASIAAFSVGSVNATGSIIGNRVECASITMQTNCRPLTQYAKNNQGVVISSSSSDLGLNSYPWRYIYYHGGLKAVSDKKVKNHIYYLKEDEALEKFFDNLQPVFYTFKDKNTGNKIHMGFYAQDVSKNSVDILQKDLALFSISSNNKNLSEEEAYRYYKQELKDNNELNWTLAYDELIAPTIAIVQKDRQRIKQLENTIIQLTKELQELKQKIM